MSRTKAHQKYIHPLTQKPVPGSTTVIGEWGDNKGALIAWARREALAGNDPNKVRDKAAAIGTIAHALVEEHLGETYPSIKLAPFNREEYPPADVDKAENAFIAYLDWEDLHCVEAIESEVELVHEKLAYGGTIDMVAMVDGKLTLVDFKTSKGVYKDHVLQAASYAKLMEDGCLMEWENGEVVNWPKYNAVPEQVIILHINKETGRMTEHRFTLSDLKPAWSIFKHLLAIRNLKGKLPI